MNIPPWALIIWAVGSLGLTVYAIYRVIAIFRQAKQDRAVIIEQLRKLVTVIKANNLVSQEELQDKLDDVDLKLDAIIKTRGQR